MNTLILICFLERWHVAKLVSPCLSVSVCGCACICMCVCRCKCVCVWMCVCVCMCVREESRLIMGWEWHLDSPASHDGRFILRLSPNTHTHMQTQTLTHTHTHILLPSLTANIWSTGRESIKWQSVLLNYEAMQEDIWCVCVGRGGGGGAKGQFLNAQLLHDVGRVQNISFSISTLLKKRLNENARVSRRLVLVGT